MDDFQHEKDSVGADQVFHSPAWKKPLAIILALFLVLVLVISIVPWYFIKSNPPPNQAVVERFRLTSAEKASMEEVEYEATASITDAIKQVNIFDYRMITLRLVSSACSTTSDLCYAKAVYYYVQNMQYVSDPETRQYVQSPAETLLAGAGDCEDFSFLMAAMLESIGIDADIGVTSNHAFVRAKVSGSFFGDDYEWLDPTSSNDFGEVSFSNKNVLNWYEVA